MSRPRIAVAVFPGSNDERDAGWALSVLGAQPVYVSHTESRLPRVSGVVIPGGFAYGDYLRCGAIARVTPLMGAIERFASLGGLVLGICNGFQILCESRLLPGALCANASLRFACRDVSVRVERADTPFTSRCRPGQELRLPVKHGEGRYVAPPEILAQLGAENRIVLRYGEGDNPNGSTADVAGIVSAEGNVMGLMPHPEHAVDPLSGSGDGAYIVSSFVASAREPVVPEAATAAA